MPLKSILKLKHMKQKRNVPFGAKSRGGIVDFTPAIPALPKGAKRYYFDIDGNHFSTRDSSTVYETVAISSKSAKEKFKRDYTIAASNTEGAGVD